MSEFYKLLCLEWDVVETVPDQNVKVALLSVGDSAIELIEPLSPESSVSRFVERRGGGLHHITFEVENIEETLDRLKASGTRLIDERPRKGAEGNLIAFIHPDSTGGVLIELCQTPNEEEFE